MAAMATPRGRQTMADDQENGAMPEMNLNSPRIQAALRVTGIDPDDLRPKPAAKIDPGSPRAETQAWKNKLRETKRRQLAREVLQQAHALTGDDVEVLLAEKGSQNLAASAPAELEAEKAKIAKLRENVKTTLQKEVHKEMIRNQKYEAATKAQEEFQLRAKEKAKEQREEHKKKAEEKAKVTARMDEKIKAARLLEAKTRREIQKKLEEKSEYVTNEFTRREKEREEADRERHRRNAEIAERNLQHTQRELDEKLQKQDLNKTRDAHIVDRLQEKEVELLRKAEEQRQKFAEKRITVAEAEEKRQQELETEFLETTLVKHKAAAAAASTLQAESREATRSARDKILTKLGTNRETIKKEERQRARGLRKKDHDNQSLELRDSQLSEMVSRQRDFRDGFGELVSQNRARIARSDDCAREQTLTKIEMNRSRLESIEASRQRLHEARMVAVREQMLGQTRIEDLKQVMKDGSASKVNKILGEMAIPLLPLETGKEGEEGDEDQKKK